jgi:mono/diheme cytochrome c family protein
MKSTLRPTFAACLSATVSLALVGGCVTAPPSTLAVKGGFSSVLPLLETNCVHCHGTQRLPSMPALVDTKSLATLIGPGKLIVPGQPEKSRLYQVVTLTDQQPGAMPPTGHAITPGEVSALRAWIQAGAPLPAQNIVLTPRGSGPRSL